MDNFNNLVHWLLESCKEDAHDGEEIAYWTQSRESSDPSLTITCEVATNLLGLASDLDRLHKEKFLELCPKIMNFARLEIAKSGDPKRYLPSYVRAIQMIRAMHTAHYIDHSEHKRLLESCWVHLQEFRDNEGVWKMERDGDNATRMNTVNWLAFEALAVLKSDDLDGLREALFDFDNDGSALFKLFRASVQGKAEQAISIFESMVLEGPPDFRAMWEAEKIGHPNVYAMFWPGYILKLVAPLRDRLSAEAYTYLINLAEWITIDLPREQIPSDLRERLSLRQPVWSVNNCLLGTKELSMSVLDIKALAKFDVSSNRPENEIDPIDLPNRIVIKLPDRLVYLALAFLYFSTMLAHFSARKELLFLFSSMAAYTLFSFTVYVLLGSRKNAVIETCTALGAVLGMNEYMFNVFYAA